MSRKFGRVSREGAGRKYKIALGVIVGTYILLYALSFFNGDKIDKSLAKENKLYTIGDYEIYMVDREYNPNKQLMVAKFYIKEKPSNQIFIPLTKDNFKAEATLKDNLDKKLKTEFIMPNKNFIVVALKDYKSDEGIAKLELSLKTDIISVNQEEETATSTTFFLNNEKEIYNDNLNIYNEQIYADEGAKYQSQFIDKEIASKFKETEKYNQEIENANKQIKSIDEQMSGFNEEEKIEAQQKQEEIKKSISDIRIKINEIGKEVNKLENEKQKINSQKH